MSRLRAALRAAREIAEGTGADLNRGRPAEPHQHVAAEEDHHPNYNPGHFDQTCACGATRYRVKGGPWTPWEIVDE